MQLWKNALNDPIVTLMALKNLENDFISKLNGLVRKHPENFVENV